MTLSHVERAERRRRIADYCRTHTWPEAAQEFGVSHNTAREACKVHGVEPVRMPHMEPVRPATMSILAALQNEPGRSLADVASAHGISRQRVQEILRRARDAGMRFGGRDG